MSDSDDFLVPGGGLHGRLFARMAREQGSEPVELAGLVAADQSRVGSSIGDYKLLRLLGSGGMGAVYLAEDTAGAIDRQVALKVLRGCAEDAALRERFERERRILAQLVHPNIARLYDGGETEAGAPYYTMEYVEGRPITEYCHANAHSVEARLRLLMQVAAALARAHGNLVIHRDIKPSNVLITADGQAKLLDFGIAKSLIATADSGITRTLAGPMTPQYAAPEQFHNQALTVATDVYQFGALIYRVLTGRLPYRADPHDPIAWGKAVTEDEPLTLTQALTGGPTANDAKSWSASVNMTRVRRALRRDLDAIVRKALAKQPEQRYRSIDALAADIEDYLAGRPVKARHAGTLYRMRRFVARNRAACAIGLIGLLAIAVMLQRLQTERIKSDAAALRAQQEAALANRSKDYVLGLIGETNIGEATQSAKLSVGEFLDAAAKRVETTLVDAPAMRAEIRTAIAASLDRYEGPRRALPLIDLAVADARSLGDAERARLLTKALVIQARSRNESGNPQGGKEAALEALALARSAPAELWSDSVTAKRALMRSANLLGDDADAYRLAREILDDHIEMLGAEHVDVAMDYQNVAYTEMYLDKFDAAEANYRRALALLRQSVPGSDNPRLGWVLNGLGLVQTRRGHYAEAAAALQQAREIYERMTSGASSNHTAHFVLNQAALALAEQRLGAAEQFLREAEVFMGPDDAGKNAPLLQVLRAQWALDSGDPGRARLLALPAQAAFAEQRGEAHPMVLRVAAFRAYADFKHRGAAAVHSVEAELRQIEQRLLNTHAPAAEERIEVQTWLAEVLDARGAAVEARRLRESSHAGAQTLYGAAHPITRRLAERVDR